MSNLDSITIIGAVVTVCATIAGGVWYIITHLHDKKKIILTSIITCVVVFLLLGVGVPLVKFAFSPSPVVSSTASPTATTNPLSGNVSPAVPPPASTPTPTASPISVSPWQPLLTQQAPDCNNPGGVEWWLGDGTSSSCENAGLALLNGGGTLTLTEINGNVVDESSFRVRVQITFTGPNDNSALASLSFSDEISTTAYGFILHSNGQWLLQISDSLTDDGNTKLTTPPRGSVSLKAGQPIMLQVIFQNSTLSGSINGQQVFSYNCPDSSLTEPTLQIIDPSRSPVFLANFELDEGS